MFKAENDYDEERRRREFYHPNISKSFDGAYLLPSIASMIWSSSSTSEDDVVVCNKLNNNYYLNVVFCWANAVE
jgi:hypothetical protein